MAQFRKIVELFNKKIIKPENLVLMYDNKGIPLHVRQTYADLFEINVGQWEYG